MTSNAIETRSGKCRIYLNIMTSAGRGTQTASGIVHGAMVGVAGPAGPTSHYVTVNIL
jgi:hypothetical protein